MDIEVWKARKKELKMTFDELAEKSNVSRRQLLYIFNGDGKNAGVETVKRIEHALGITEEQSEYSEDEKKLLALIAEMTDEEAEEHI